MEKLEKNTWSNEEWRGYSILCRDFFYLDTEIETVEILKSSEIHKIIRIITVQYYSKSDTSFLKMQWPRFCPQINWTVEQ